MTDGKYTLVNQKNMEAILTNLGFPADLPPRIYSADNVMTMTMSSSGNTYTVDVKSTKEKIFDQTTTYKLGETTEIKNPVPMKVTLTKSSDMHYTSCTEMSDGKKLDTAMFFNNYGATFTLSIQGTGICGLEIWQRMEPTVDGYYVFDSHKNAEDIWLAEMPESAHDAVRKMIREKDISSRMRFCGNQVWSEASYGGHAKTATMTLDKEFKDVDEAFGTESTGVISKVGPGSYSMAIKNLKTGNTTSITLDYSDEGVLEKGVNSGKEFEIFYRREADIEGTWKTVSASGVEGYLSALGVPEPMKSTLVNEKDSSTFKRLPGGLISMTSTSKMSAGEIVFKYGEQFSFEQPGMGTMSGVISCNKETLLMAMKVGNKTISGTMKVSGNFMVSEFEVDNMPCSRVKYIAVRA